MKKLIKKLLPKNALSYYHKSLAVLSAVLYRWPSNKMIVVGITGTNGKSTTVDLVAKVLEAGGAKVGSTSTVKFKIAEKEWLNDKKMTMLGRFQLQKLLKQMVQAGCKYAVVEVSSEGIKQYRHLGINFDYAIFTNLTPEHLESHGGFENYKKAKGELFSHLLKRKKKLVETGLNPVSRKASQHVKTSIINIDDEQAEYFLNFPADKKVTFSIKNDKANLTAENISISPAGTTFDVEDVKINLKLIGAFNVENALPAVAVGLQENITIDKIKIGLESLPVVPGRMEVVQSEPFTVLVDYAPEPASMKKLYDTVHKITENTESTKTVHVLGSCGGGRDKDRRPILGKMAGKNADIVIVTNEDPYDDDPMQIINDVAEGAIQAGKELDKNLFKILDRKEAIAKAISLAEPGDLVLVTGKGSEQRMAVADGKYVEWDDRKVIKGLL